jgi:hypothetical protein
MAWVSPWPAVGDSLDTTTFKNDMFYHQAYQGDNFLELLVPKVGDETKFFGTNILNIFIAQKAYGWVNCGRPDEYSFSWPPAGFDDMRNRYLACKDRFASYSTLIWVDTYSALLARAINPSTDWPTMMAQTRDAIIDFCSNTPGFSYMGEIGSAVPPSFFEPYIQTFLGDQPYRVKT